LSSDDAIPAGRPGPAGAPVLADLPLVHSGKVRDLYQLPGDRLLMVASDRVSAFDVILPTLIPDKGAILTQLSLWWFGQLADLAPNHVVSTDVPAEVSGRAIVCERLAMVPVECVARGYLTGSGLADYAAGGAVCGISLPAGLVDGSHLPEPIFTPTTKAPKGRHDTAMTYADVVEAVGAELAAELRRLTLAVYDRGVAAAAAAGVLLADTKVEMGRRADGTLVLADELLTPDSSRFWPAASWRPGGPQPSYDKQFVRDWLLTSSGWRRDSGEPPPPLPDQIVEATRARYVQAYERLTGDSWR